jgi:hypothetical protein
MIIPKYTIEYSAFYTLMIDGISIISKCRREKLKKEFDEY